MGSVIISCSAPPDKGKGISTYSQLVALCFKARNYEVYYVCPKTDSNIWFVENTINPIFFDLERSEEENTVYLYHKLTNIGEDAVIINNDVIFIQALAPILTNPILSVVHLASNTILSCALLNYDFTDYIVCISNDMLIDLSVRKRIPSQKLAMITNGLPIKKLSSNKDFTKLNIVTGIEFSYRKGSKDLLKLLNYLKESSLEFTFTWFGLERTDFFKDFENDKRFSFHQKLPRTDYLKKIKDANIYLFPSKEEGCPMSLKEAMQMGIVPITTNGIGAMGQIVRHNIDGYYIDKAHWPKEAFQLLKSLSQNPYQLASRSKRANERISESFNIDTVADGLISLLENVEVKKKTKCVKVIDIYKWHRLPLDFKKNNIKSILELIKYRIGYLSKVKAINLDTDN